jgi:hypothetical protein
MANHVSYQVWFREINDAAKARWKEMTDNLQNDRQDGYEYWFGDLFVDNKEGSPTLDEVREYSWTTEVIGPKWCYIQDYDEDSFSGYSAWSPPETGLVKILEELEKLDPKMVTSITYDDEMPNFVGWSVYVGSEMEDGCEDDYEDIQFTIFNNHPHLKEHWDEDNEEWATDEDGDCTEETSAAQDEFQEYLYDTINIMQEDGIQSVLTYLHENSEEE